MQEILISVCIGIGLAASVGFRIFLPLLMVSIAAYFDILPIHDDWNWIGSLTAIVTLSIATVVEIGAYYIPWVDNLLDSIAIPLAGIAGTAIMMTTMVEVDPVITWALAIIAGGGTAATVKSTMGASRLTSTATTGGFANPLITTIETGTATVISIVSIIAPLIAIILVIALFFGVKKLYRKVFAKKT